MVWATNGHTATLLVDGRVLVVDESGAQLYDPNTNFRGIVRAM